MRRAGRRWLRDCVLAPVLVFTITFAGIQVIRSATSWAWATPQNYRITFATPPNDPVVSKDGRHVVYEAAPTGTSTAQIYLWNADSATTTLISADSLGNPGNDGSSSPSVSADGRYVAFESAATNLGPTSGSSSVYVRDTINQTTSLVSAGLQNTYASGATSMTSDGRYIVFVTYVGGSTHMDVYVRDVVSGTTSKVSVANGGAASNGNSQEPGVSDDGRFVTFESDATNLVLGDTNGRDDVFVRDRTANTTTLVSQSSQGVEGINGDSMYPSISGDGNLIAFESDALGLATGGTTSWNIYVRNRSAKTTRLVSLNSSQSAAASGNSDLPSISDNGAYLVYQSDANNIVSPALCCGISNIFRARLNSDGSLAQTARVSIGWNSQDSPSDWPGSENATVSSTGRYVAFDSWASNMVQGDSGPGSFLRDMGEQDPPVISSLSANPSAFSPNGDGTQDTTGLSASVSDASPPITWAITIKNSLGTAVRAFAGTWTQTNNVVSVVWDGRNDSGVLVPDGTYTWTVTATDEWGNTASATADVVVDTLSPAFSSSSPSPFQDVTSVGSISITWQDPLSGINPSSAQISIDGSAVSTSVSGNTETANVSNLPPGIHQAIGQITDKAGNTAAQPFIFTDVSLAADPVNAHLQSVTVPVNPSGKVPGPSTVTFHGVQVTAAQFHEFMNASTWVGYGLVARQANFGSLKVTFSNGTPLTASANATIPVGSFVQQMGALSPSGTQLGAIVPAQSVTLPDFSVTVPTGYNTSGSTATLPWSAIPLSAPAPQGALLGSQFPNSITALGHIAGCQERHPSGVNSFCTIDQTPGLQIQVPGSGPINGFSPLTSPVDQSNEAQIPPSCTGCASSFDVIQARLVLGCDLYTIGGTNTSVDLCNGTNPSPTRSGKYFGSYLNGWIYTIPNGASGGASTYPFWRQDHIDLGTDECPNGGRSSGSVTAVLNSAASDTLALDAATNALSAGTWPATAPFIVKLGTVTGPTDSSSGAGVSYVTTSRPYQLQNQTSLLISPKLDGYKVKRGATVDESGNETSTASGSYNSWSSSTPVTDRLQLVDGTEFLTPSTVGGYAYSGVVPFQFTLTFNC